VRRKGVKRRRVGMKRAPARRARGRMYGNKRPKRIQRATAVPKSALISFVTDKTFLYTPEALPSGDDPLSTGILQVSCNNLITPMLGDVGTWTAQEGTAGDAVEGLDDWLQHAPGGADGAGRYQTYTVLGAKVDVNSIASHATGTAPTGGYVNNYSVGIHKNSNDLSDVTAAISQERSAVQAQAACHKAPVSPIPTLPRSGKASPTSRTTHSFTVLSKPMYSRHPPPAESGKSSSHRVNPSLPTSRFHRSSSVSRFNTPCYSLTQ
jgi:hypothetical protein